MLIHDYDFKPQQNKASIERGIKFLERTQKLLQSGTQGNHNGMYAIHGLKPIDDREILSGACHASIASGTTNCDLVSTLTHRLDKYPVWKDRVQGDSCLVNAEIVEKFTQWFTQQSLYSRFFVPMPLEFNVNFGLLISSDIPSGLLQNMCIISRHTREKGVYLRFWNDLVEKGINPDIAYIIATNTVDYGDVIGPGGNGHFVLPTHLSIQDAALRGVAGDLYGLENAAKTYREAPSIYGGSQYFVTGKMRLDADTWERHWLAQTNNLINKPPETLVSSIPNPFKKKPITSGNPSLVPKSRFMDEIIPRFVEEVQNYLSQRNLNSVEDNSRIAA